MSFNQRGELIISRPCSKDALWSRDRAPVLAYLSLARPPASSPPGAREKATTACDCMLRGFNTPNSGHTLHTVGRHRPLASFAAWDSLLPSIGSAV
jgi:hypothetical protein